MKQASILLSLLALLVAISACGALDASDPSEADAGGPIDPRADDDGDGYTAAVDCDDQNAAIHPQADELCDGVDNDCDNLIDAQDEELVGGIALFYDGDGDGQGAGEPVLRCTVGDGWVDNADDCNDLRGDVFVGQSKFFADPYSEGCDDPHGCFDYNCDGENDLEHPRQGGCHRSGVTCTYEPGFSPRFLSCGGVEAYIVGCDQVFTSFCTPFTEERDVRCH